MSQGIAASGAGPVSAGKARLVLYVLTFVYIINFLDRQLLAILAKQIKDTLHVSDYQLGLIGGFYFACFYCFIAIPIGWFADRTNRVTVLSLACAIWSAATAACGLANNYGQLVAARMMVGFGEAGGVPPSYAIITDTFPPGKRGAAFGIYNFGPPAGAAAGVAFGGWIAIEFGWRQAFLTIGAIGIVTALLVRMLLRDPVRGGMDTAPAGVDHSEKAPFWATTAMFFQHPVLLLAALGSGATQFVTYGLGQFAVLFLREDKGMTAQQVTIWYALALLIGMGGSMIVSGKLLDAVTRKSRTGYALAPAIALAVAMPFYVAFVWAPGWQMALALLTVVMLFNYVYLSASVALVQDEVKPSQRVLCGALLLLVMNFIGLGLGPTYVGFASTWLGDHGYQHTLQLALYSITPFYLIAIGLFLWLAYLLRKEARTGIKTPLLRPYGGRLLIGLALMIGGFLLGFVHHIQVPGAECYYVGALSPATGCIYPNAYRLGLALAAAMLFGGGYIELRAARRR